MSSTTKTEHRSRTRAAWVCAGLTAVGLLVSAGPASATNHHHRHHRHHHLSAASVAAPTPVADTGACSSDGPTDSGTSTATSTSTSSPTASSSGDATDDPSTPSSTASSTPSNTDDSSTSAPTACGTDAPPVGSGTGTLAWAPPALSSPTTIHITSQTRNLKLDAGQDYVLDFPTTPVDMVGGMSITGGHNVVAIGGEIVTQKRSNGHARGLYLKGQTGTIHLEGLRLSGSDATEGINLDERLGATVQLQNIAVETVHGSYSTTHADVLQTWAGPKVLRVDRLEGSTTYQGFFLDPGKFGHAIPTSVDLRHVVLRDSGGHSAYLLWQSGTFPIHTQNVTVVRNPSKPFPKQVVRTVHSQASWSAVTNGASSTGSPLVGQPGATYRSPGYASGSGAGDQPTSTATGTPIKN